MPKPMNLIVICSDQHNPRLVGAYGAPYNVKTPNIDAMAKRGILFSHAYCSSPVCVPSRSSMVTGKYVHDGKFWDNAQAYHGECPSFATRLDEQGFPVTAIGKMHLRDDSPATGFKDERITLQMADGVGDIYGCIRDGKISRPQFLKAIKEAGPGSTDYTRYDRAVAAYAVDYIRKEAKQQKKPFFLYVGFVSPHFPLTVPKEYIDLYPENVVEPIGWLRSQWSHHPVLDEYRRYCHSIDVTDSEMNNARRTYMGLCSFLDEQVGIVLDAIRANGLDKNTRVIYTSDHGDLMGEHGLFFKSTMYEGSVGVPFIMTGPDIPAGYKCDTPISLVDLYPTILEALGAERSEYDKGLPGKSIFTYVGKPTDENRAVFSEYHAFGINSGEYMVRKGDWKLISYVGYQPQLFNLRDDPNEMHDLGSDPNYHPVVEAMTKVLEKFVNPEKADREAKESQKRILAQYGGKEEFLANYKPRLFSPIPKNL